MLCVYCTLGAEVLAGAGAESSGAVARRSGSGPGKMSPVVVAKAWELPWSSEAAMVPMRGDAEDIGLSLRQYADSIPLSGLGVGQAPCVRPYGLWWCMRQGGAGYGVHITC